MKIIVYRDTNIQKTVQPSSSGNCSVYYSMCRTNTEICDEAFVL